MSSLKVSLNATILYSDQTCISYHDRGFRFGDGVFETVAIVNRTAYLWQAHCERLKLGLQTLSIEANLDHLDAHLHHLIRENKVVDGVARIFVTRGCGSQGYLPDGTTDPTVILEVIPSQSHFALNEAPALRLMQSKWRRFPSICLPTDVKIMQGMNAILARIEASTNGYDEALMLSVTGEICEAASGNLFWLEAGQLVTPSLSTGCLAGTMRARLMELWEKEAREISIPLDTWQQRLPRALIMTNSLRGAVAVSSLTTHHTTYHFSDSPALAEQCNRLIRNDAAAFP